MPPGIHPGITRDGAQGERGRRFGGGLAANDVYVAPLVKSVWMQGTLDDTSATPHCYDAYTHWGPPDTYFPCGCNATAMAQVMLKWRHPAAAVAPAAFDIDYWIGHTKFTKNEPLLRGTLAGGAYDWANMTLDPLYHIANFNAARQRAIGGLTHDAGVAIKTNYNIGSAGGSSAVTLDAADALKNVFMYSNAIKGSNNNNNIPLVDIYKMVNPNLEAGHPVLFAIFGPSGGHAIVGDGYGKNNDTWYHHLNMGWANDGGSNAWYNLPDINPPQFTFNTIKQCVYNIFPTGTGELISGRVTDPTGRPISGVNIETSVPISGGNLTTNAHGVYFLRVPAGTKLTVTPTGVGGVEAGIFTPAFREVEVLTSTDNTITTGNQWEVNFQGITYNTALDNYRFVFFR